MASVQRRKRASRRLDPARLLRALLATEYSAGTDERTWLQELLQAAEGFLDHGMGVMGWFFRAETQYAPTVPTAVNGAERLVDVAVRVSAALGSSSLETVLAPIPCLSTASEAHGLGLDLLRNVAYRQHAHPFGVRDFLALKSVSSSGQLGCLIGAPLADITSSRGYEIAHWNLLARHMSLALGARANAAAPPAAVFEPNGRPMHASGACAETSCLAALRRAVLARERARRARAPEDAIQMLALASGAVAHWSLIDQFESDGRRYVVACDSGGREAVVHAALPGLSQAGKLEAFRRLDELDRRIVWEMVTTRAANKEVAAKVGLNLRALEKRVEGIADEFAINVSRGQKVRPLLIRLLTTP